MKKFGLLISFLLLTTQLTWGQTSTQNFGTGTGIHTSQTGSTTFIPNPTDGTTWARAGATAPNAPIVLATASNPLSTSDTYVRGVASTSTSVTKFSPIVSYTGSTEFYTSFKVLFGDASASNTATTGSWTFSQGNGSTFSDASAISSQAFCGLRFTFGEFGGLTLANNNNGTWNTTSLSTTIFSQATVYNIEIIGNNKSSGDISYTYNGALNTVAINKFDLFINGTLVGNDLPKAPLANNTDIVSNAFTGINSADNVANIFVDDVVVYNSVPASIGTATPTISVNPTSLTGFTYVVGSGPSAEQSYTVSGLNLTDDISITPPTNYEISTGTGGSFSATDPITMTPDDGTVDETTIYVRLKAGLVVGNYDSEDITATSTDATDKTVTCSGSVTNAWINELHYDNDGDDVGEFVEVIIQNPGDYTLSDFLVTLYNGDGGTLYNTKTLDLFTFGVVDPIDDSFSYYYYPYPVNGIQNGGLDGLCLSYQGTVIQFLSYGGTFAATDGVANGITSTDIGVSQAGTEAVGSSLGLTGTGTQYSDFTWTDFSNDTPGSPNGSQALPVELSSFSASVIGSAIKLSWRTETEVNNYGFEILRQGHTSTSLSVTEWEKIGFVEGYGNSNSPKDYSFTDASVVSGTYSYRLKQIDIDGTSSYSKVIEVDLGAPKKYELAQNFPNPFNPNTSIKFTLPETGNVKLTVYNMLGQEIATLVNGVKEAGTHIINFNAEEFNSGVYIYRIESNGFNEVRKMTLIK